MKRTASFALAFLGFASVTIIAGCGGSSPAIVIAVGDPTQKLWIYDIARGVRTRFTFEGTADNTPVWSPDGKRIAFTQRHVGALDI